MIVFAFKFHFHLSITQFVKATDSSADGPQGLRNSEATHFCFLQARSPGTLDCSHSDGFGAAAAHVTVGKARPAKAAGLGDKATGLRPRTKTTGGQALHRTASAICFRRRWARPSAPAAARCRGRSCRPCRATTVRTVAARFDKRFEVGVSVRSTSRCMRSDSGRSEAR